MGDESTIRLLLIVSFFTSRFLVSICSLIVSNGVFSVGFFLLVVFGFFFFVFGGMVFWSGVVGYPRVVGFFVGVSAASQ